MGSRSVTSHGGRAKGEQQRKQNKHHDTTQIGTHCLPQQLQQSILDVFTQAFPVMSQQDDFKRIMQEVKGHLYNRDFSSAFGKQEYLDVYASRWSAARALAYADIFTHPSRHTWFVSLVKHDADVLEHKPDPIVRSASDMLSTANVGTQTGSKSDAVPTEPLARLALESPSKSIPQPATDTTPNQMRVLCIGGGAGAEVVALAATTRYIHALSDHARTRTDVSGPPSHLNIHAIDIADWSQSVARLSSAITSAPTFPTYTTQAVRDGNRPLVIPDTDGSINISFQQQDILQSSPAALKQTLHQVSLVTIAFTLNELFTTSLPKTTAFLLNLTEAIPQSAHLVIIDSPGSYSEIKLGTSKPSASATKSTSSPPTSQQNTNTDSTPTRKYPMKWLLDHTLLNVAGKGPDARWTKVEDEDSKWFRIDDKSNLRYGVDLENCRYQIHVFRKIN